MTGLVRRSTDRELPSPGPAAAPGRPATRPSAAEAAETRLMAEIEAALLGDVPSAPAQGRREPPPPPAAPDRPSPVRPPVRLWPRTEAAADEEPSPAAGKPASAPASGGTAPMPQAPAAGRVAADRLRADRLPADAETRFDDTPAAAETSATDASAAADDPWPAEGRWSPSAKAGRRERRRGDRIAIAAAAFLVLAAASGGALLLALPDADSPAPGEPLAAGSPGSARDGTAAGADGDAASDSPRTVATVRVVEAPSTPPGGAPAQAETSSGPDAAQGTPSPAAAPGAPAIGTTALRGSTDASTDGSAAGQDPADASAATAPVVDAADDKIVTRLEGGEPGGVRLEEALVAAAAARARLAGTPTPADATSPVGQPAGSAGAVDASAASAGASAGDPAATGAAGAATGGAMPIDPGGFGVVPLRAPREAGGNAAPAGQADAPVRTAAADPTEPAPQAEAAATAQAEAPATSDAGVAPPAGAARPGRIVSAVNMRAGPDNDAATIKVIPAGAAVQVVSCDYWCEVDFGGTRGWVYKRFVDAAAAAAQ